MIVGECAGGEPERRHGQQVRILHLAAPAFRALADGDLDAANAVSPVPLSAYFAGPEWRSVWQMRNEQAQHDPASAAWVTGIIWDERRQVAVGRAGYHGPPDVSGMVEIGLPSIRHTGGGATPGLPWRRCCSAPPANRKYARCG